MKHPEKPIWYPNQRMPLDFFFEHGKLRYSPGFGLQKNLSYKHALEIAKDAEILAKELREAAEMIVNKSEEFND